MSKTAQYKKPTKSSHADFCRRLLGWYDRHRRVLPWRASGDAVSDPYHVWLSEIMLQQTTVGAVTAYFLKFIELWPNIQALASAPVEQVMKEWAGLGYYARARNLHACAGIVAHEMGGVFPKSQSELKKLPGIGDYTSAAIMAIAYNQPAVVVDGNVERVMARYHAVQTPLPKAKPELKSLAAPFFEECDERPGDLAQAFMDLGATICIAGTPRCSLCPVAAECQARVKGMADSLPNKDKGKSKPQKFGYVYWIKNGNGQILLHRRPGKGMLGGMVGLPTSEWTEKYSKAPGIFKTVSARHLTRKPSIVRHSFTHFDLELSLMVAAEVESDCADSEYFWVNFDHIADMGFPTLFKKALNVFLQSER